MDTFKRHGNLRWPVKKKNSSPANLEPIALNEGAYFEAKNAQKMTCRMFFDL